MGKANRRWQLFRRKITGKCPHTKVCSCQIHGICSVCYGHFQAFEISRRAKKLNPDVVIVDPIYKVLTGDENSAEQMARFCNEFDKLCTQLNASTIYCHHHSKGAMDKYDNAMDRSSGSGVFARDPDAILTMTQLDWVPAIEEEKDWTAWM